MKFDELLTEIGEFGLYQKYVFLLTWPLNILAGFFLLNPVVLLATPLHRADNTNVTMTTCDRWVYDTSVFKNTYISQMDLVCDREIWGANAAMMLYGGMLFGSIVCGFLADRFGRKPVVFVSALCMTGSGLAMAWVENYACLVALEFLLGAATVGSFLTGYIVSLEITGTKMRRWPGICVNFPYCIGLLLYAGIAFGFRSVTPIQMTTSLPGVLLVSYWWLMPESPRWLLSRGRVNEAESILKRAARWNKTSLPPDFFDIGMMDEIRQEDNGGSFAGLLKNRTMFGRLVLICFNWAACAFCYYGLALNTEHLSGNFYLNFFLSSLVEVPAYFIIIGSMERFGRRLIYIIVMVVGGASCVSTLLAIEYANDNELLTVVLAMIGRLGVTAGFCVQYIHTAEIFPTVLRNAGMGVASVFARAGSMVAPYIVSLGGTVGGSFGRALPLIIVGAFGLLSSVATGFLPETVNKDLPDTVKDGETLGKQVLKDRQYKK